MQYINKNTGKVAADLQYSSHGCWDVFPHNDNRYRILKGDNKLISAIDLNTSFGMIEVGKELPGYNRVVSEIVYVVDDDKEYFEVFCDDEFTID
mgnify:CR=1 FL=1